MDQAANAPTGFAAIVRAVMYNVDELIYIGGGHDLGKHEPTAAAEVIDLSRSPPRVAYGFKSEVTTSNPDEISQVSRVGSSSVTHSFDQHQRTVFPRSEADAVKLTVTARSRRTSARRDIT